MIYTDTIKKWIAFAKDQNADAGIPPNNSLPLHFYVSVMQVYVCVHVRACVC